MESQRQPQDWAQQSPGRPGDRVPPQNLDAERAILGAILLDKEAAGLASEKVEPADFYRKEHEVIFAAMRRLYAEDQSIDAILVYAEVKEPQEKSILDRAGGIDYLNALAGSVATAANVSFHAGIVRQKAVLRHLIHTSTVIAAEAFEGADEAAEILDRAQTRIYSLSEESRRGGFATVDEVVHDAIKSIEEAYSKQEEIPGLRTGLTKLDRLTGGLQKSDLIILAARPAMGKTSLALNIAYNAAVKVDRGVAIFSLEMAKEQLVLRMLCSSTGFNLHNLRRGKLQPEDWPRLTRAAGRLSAAKIFIDDSSGISVLEMKAKARRLQQQHGIGLIIVDYLQLMNSPTRVENRQQEISHISRNLKGLAKDLNIPVLALSQLSRAVEARGKDARPKLSDLRESGAIEQDADVVLFIHRDESGDVDDPTVGNLATIIIGKQRNGPTGQFDVHFHKAYTKFSDLQE